ncbi:MAG: M48 family metalloprotease [Bacteroidetes bacterium]|nr:M48 family metalloprotease [Bacteroidota bacterium]
MNELNDNSNSWSSLSILAHEVGHHINGHSLDVVLYAVDMVDKESLTEQRQQELEADEFSGFVMAKLGASLNQASEAIANLSSNNDDSYSTHPSRDKRLNAIRTGYNKGNTNNTPIAYKTPTTL